MNVYIDMFLYVLCHVYMYVLTYRCVYIKTSRRRTASLGGGEVDKGKTAIPSTCDKKSASRSPYPHNTYIHSPSTYMCMCT